MILLLIFFTGINLFIHQQQKLQFKLATVSSRENGFVFILPHRSQQARERNRT